MQQGSEWLGRRRPSLRRKRRRFDCPYRLADPSDMMPGHVWELATEWCSLRDVLVLSTCSISWRNLAEARLLPQHLRQLFGTGAVDSFVMALPQRLSWALFARDALCFCSETPREGHPLPSPPMRRLDCRVALDRCPEASAQDRFGNVTLLNRLRIDPSKLTGQLYFEFFVGSNTSGNVLVGLMRDRAPEQMCRRQRLPNTSSVPEIRRPLTFAVCANTGEIFVEGKQFTTTRKGAAAIDAPVTDNHRSPLVVGIQVNRHSKNQVRLAFFVQRVRNEGEIVDSHPCKCEMIVPVVVTAFRQNECLRFGVEMCVQLCDRSDWVTVRGPRPGPPAPTDYHIVLHGPCSNARQIPA